MGIPGLLGLLQPATNKVSLSEYANQKVAVDAYSWLHKGAYSCSRELCQGIPTEAYINYCINLVKMLQFYKVIPVLVFDGGRLPSKGDKEEERRAKRDGERAKALAFLNEGNVSSANACFQKAVDISPQMAYNLIKVLKAMGVEYIVAPYEADAQMAYLALNGLVAAVITEDSDLLAYGTPRVLFKMDKHGNAQEVKFEDIFVCKEPSFANWTQEMFRHMCVLIGCDYTPSMHGMGPKTAHSYMRKYRNIDKVFKVIKAESSLKMPEGYEDDFKRADLTFLHQRVWDPVLQAVVPLSPLDDVPPEVDIYFIGAEIPADVAVLIATAVVDPSTLKRFEEEDNRSAISQKMQMKVKGNAVLPKLSKKEQLTIPAQKNTIPNYFLKGVSNLKKPFVAPRKTRDSPPHDNGDDLKQFIQDIKNEILPATTAPSLPCKRIVVSRHFSTGKAITAKGLSRLSDSMPSPYVPNKQAPPITADDKTLDSSVQGAVSSDLPDDLQHNSSNSNADSSNGGSDTKGSDEPSSDDVQPDYIHPDDVIDDDINGDIADHTGLDDHNPNLDADEANNSSSTKSSSDDVTTTGSLVSSNTSSDESNDDVLLTNSLRNTNISGKARVEKEEPVYASNPKRKGPKTLAYGGSAAKKRPATTSGARPSFTGRGSRDRLSLPHKVATHVGDVKGSFDGYIQQFMFSRSSSAGSISIDDSEHDTPAKKQKISDSKTSMSTSFDAYVMRSKQPPTSPSPPDDDDITDLIDDPNSDCTIDPNPDLADDNDDVNSIPDSSEPLAYDTPPSTPPRQNSTLKDFKVLSTPESSFMHDDVSTTDPPDFADGQQQDSDDVIASGSSSSNSDVFTSPNIFQRHFNKTRGAASSGLRARLFADDDVSDRDRDKDADEDTDKDKDIGDDNLLDRFRFDRLKRSGSGFAGFVADSPTRDEHKQTIFGGKTLSPAGSRFKLLEEKKKQMSPYKFIKKSMDTIVISDEE